MTAEVTSSPAVTPSLPHSSPPPLTPTAFTNPTGTILVASLPLFPIAATLSALLVLFLVIIAALLLIRKILKNKGLLQGVSWFPQYTCGSDKPGCTDKCLQLAEVMDCSTPSCQAFLDRICPSKKQCSMTCSKVWSCYCCTMLGTAWDEVEICPSCSAMECPDCSCCGDCCHCTMRAPECSHITCLCFECGKAP